MSMNGRKAVRFTVIAIMLLAVCMLTGCGTETISLNEYVNYEFKGYDSVGTVSWDFSGKAITDIANAVSNQKMNDLQTQIAFGEINDAIKGNFDKTTNLSNGETIKFVWNIEPERASSIKKNYHIDLKYSDITVTVEGLEAIPTFDAFSDMEVTYHGFDGYGTCEVVSGKKGITFSVDRESGLKNGDTITVSVNETAEECFNKLKEIPLAAEKTYTVSGLTAIIDGDPFEKISIGFSGTNGEGMPEIESEKYPDVTFSCDKTRNISNGDVLKVSITDAEAQKLVEEYGVRANRTSLEYTVSELEDYVRDVSELNESFFRDAEKALDEFVSKNTPENLGYEPTGYYLLYSDADKENRNILYLVYKFDYHYDSGFLGPEDVTAYKYLRINNVMINNGRINADFSEAEYPKVSFFPLPTDEGFQTKGYHTMSGYKTVEDFENKRITPSAAEYTITTTVEK